MPCHETKGPIPRRKWHSWPQRSQLAKPWSGTSIFQVWIIWIRWSTFDNSKFKATANPPNYEMFLPQNRHSALLDPMLPMCAAHGHDQRAFPSDAVQYFLKHLDTSSSGKDPCTIESKTISNTDPPEIREAHSCGTYGILFLVFPVHDVHPHLHTLYYTVCWHDTLACLSIWELR